MEIDSTGVYTANMVDGIVSGSLVKVIDDPADPFAGKDYVWVPPGDSAFQGQIALTGAPADDYHVFIYTRFDSPSAGELWIKADDEPFRGPPSNVESDFVNGRVPLPSPGWVQLGRVGSLVNYSANVRDTTERVLTVGSGDTVYMMLRPGLQISCIALRPVGDTDPVDCPDEDAGGGGNPIASYQLKEIGANSPNINGSLDSFVGQANAIAYTGLNNGATGACTTRLAWDDSTNRIYFWHSCTVASLLDNGQSGTEDAGNVVFGSSIRVNLRLVDQQRIKDAETYMFAANAFDDYYDRNELNGSANASYDFSARQVAATYSDPDLVIEGYFEPDEDLTADQLLLLEVSFHELRSGMSQVSQWATCTAPSGTSDPSCWMVAQLVSTAMETPPDETAPTVGNPACTPSASGAVCVATVDEDATCRAFRDADNDAEVTDDAEFVTTNCGPSVGGNCSCSFSGLTAPDHEMIVEATDASGNVGLSAIADFSLTAGGVTGDSFYVDDTGGSNSNDCETDSTPCLTVAGVMAKAAFGPGDTINLMNGTHATGSGKAISINCATNTSKFNGTSTLPITLKAQNERQAKLLATVENVHTLSISNCEYWVVQGIYFEADDFTDKAGVNPEILSSKNMTFKWNLINKNNKCGNTTGMQWTGSSDSLVLENEMYDNSRSGIKGCDRCILRANYFNSRSSNDPPCSGGTDQQGDSGPNVYSIRAQNTIIESNVVEDYKYGVFIGCNQGASYPLRNIKLYGNIIYSTLMGAQTQSYGTTEALSCSGNIYTDNVIIGYRDVGFNNRSPANINGTGLIFRNNTAIAVDVGKGVGKNCLATDMPSDWYGSKNYKVEYYRNLCLKIGSGSSTGMLVEDPVSNGQSGNTLSWIREENNVFGFTTPYSPAGSTGNGTSTGNTVVDPELGDARICIPTDSPMRTAGSGGTMIGADARYRYENGVKTSTKLWTTVKPDSGFSNSTSGWYFTGCRARVAGVNDVAGSSCANAADRMISASAATATAVLNSCEPDGSY